MGKLTQRQLSALRSDYLAKREELLQSRVSSLSVKLFDRVFDSYLTALELSDGKLVLNERNVNMVNGLDAIYKVFRDADNVPVIKSFVTDLQKIVPLNERYFKNIAQRDINTTTERATAITNNRLGVDADGNVIKDGFVDKFIRDNSIVKKIKKQTMKALTNGTGFQDFRQQLQTTIQGIPEQKLSGDLQAYYRNYAYDTYQKVDRLNQDVFAKELGLRYFYWQGGLIKTSRPICRLCNGMLIDSIELGTLSYSDIKDTLVEVNGKEVPFNSGLTEDWNPVNDLGQHGCRHSKDYVADFIAQKYPHKILDLSELTN